MPFQIRKHSLRIILFLFCFVSIFVTARALAEVVYSLLGCKFCEAAGVYSEISL